MNYNKEEFIKNFSSTFIATWCANNYDNACIKDEHEKLYNPPIEDAIHLASEIWDKFKEHIETECPHVKKLKYKYRNNNKD